jgi:hypothetical protein
MTPIDFPAVMRYKNFVPCQTDCPGTNWLGATKFPFRIRFSTSLVRSCALTARTAPIGIQRNGGVETVVILPCGRLRGEAHLINQGE